MDNRKIEKEENVPKEATNIATVETRTPLSYSDILKSKPSQIQVHINTFFYQTVQSRISFIANMSYITLYINNAFLA